MRLETSSNIVSAVYVVAFDLVLPIFLAFLISRLLSSWNLKLIYTNREQVCLSSTRCALFVHQGLTKKSVGRFAGVLSSVIVSMAIAGSFSVNGVSRPRIVTTTFPIVLEKGRLQDVIDYTQHVSGDGSSVSGTFLLAKDSRLCVSTFENAVRYHSVVNNISDTGAVIWPARLRLGNSTCRTKENKFVERVVMHHEHHIDIMEERNCTIELERTKSSMMSPANARLRGRCKFQAVEAWCSSFRKLACVVLLEYPNGFTTALIPRRNNSKVPNGILPSLLDEKLGTRSLQSMAYLSDLTLLGHEELRVMSVLSVRRNAPVETFAGTVKETEIDLHLLAATLGPACILTLMLALISAGSWRRHVVRAGRQGYNCFHSASDMLSCAASEAFKNGTCKFLEKKEVIVGMSHKNSLHGSDFGCNNTTSEKRDELGCFTIAIAGEQTREQTRIL